MCTLVIVEEKMDKRFLLACPHVAYRLEREQTMYKHLCFQRRNSGGDGFKLTPCEALLPLRLPWANLFTVPRASLCHPCVPLTVNSQSIVPCPAHLCVLSTLHQECALTGLGRHNDEQPAGWRGPVGGHMCRLRAPADKAVSLPGKYP